jgi:hypothetical protein
MLPAGRKFGCLTHKGQPVAGWKTQKGAKKGPNIEPLIFFHEGTN